MNQQIFGIVLVGTHLVALFVGVIMGVYGLRKAASLHEAFLLEDKRNELAKEVGARLADDLEYDPLAIDDGFSVPARKV